MKRSSWPSARRKAKTKTPAEEPTTPPARSTRPSFTSSVPPLEMVEGARDRRGDDLIGAGSPRRWQAGCCRRSGGGVMRKPPPTPNIPDRKPTAPPMARSTRMLTDVSAMGEIDAHRNTLLPAQPRRITPFLDKSPA